MRRDRLIAGLLILSVVAAVAALRRGPDRPRVGAAVAAAASDAEVRVRHEFVTAAPASLLTPRTTLPGLPARRAVQRNAEHRAPRPGLIARARRAVTGDGRHRPEPFPRVKED